MNKKLTLLGVVLCITLCSAKVTFRRSLVTSSEPSLEATSENTNEAEKNDIPVVPKIYEMRVDTNVSNRYAKTQVTSKVRNLDSKAREATFSIVTPDKAFISGFIMEIDGKKYEAYVQEKEEAKQTYDQAVASGQSAAHVAVSARDSNRFTVSVNVEPASKATFYLRYEELLSRKNEKYELVLNIHPGQPVKHLEVQVNIAESRPLKFVKAPSLRSGNEISKNKSNIDPEADIKTINETSAIVIFKPDIIKQKLFASSLGGKEENGLSGQFIVQYEVERDPSGGEVLVDGGYFVHFFAPEDLPPLKKQVVFILDTSGSMGGTRITQLKEAMNSILGELKEEDIFSIVEFNSVIKVWDVPEVKVTYQEGEDPYKSYGYYGEPTTEKPKEQLNQTMPPSVKGSKDHIKKAKEVIQKLDAFGGTDIQSAIKVGLGIVARNKDPKSHQPIIVFLTDGEPTVGEISTVKITSTITELNTQKVPLFSLSFGDGADREFLQKLSLKNQGFARHIYEAADANLQLEDFYKQISSPLLSDVKFKYVDKVKNVTRTHFPILFGGGELYTTGIIIDPGFTPPAVEGWGVHGPIHLQPKVYHAVGSLERLWAYLTVKQLLEQREVAEDKKGPTQDALRLALKYSFVTDVSSLVVVKPNATSAVETEDAAKSDRDYTFGFGGGFPPVALSGAPGASYALSAQAGRYPAPNAPSGYYGGGIQFQMLAGPPNYAGFAGLPAPSSHSGFQGAAYFRPAMPKIAVDSGYRSHSFYRPMPKATVDSASNNRYFQLASQKRVVLKKKLGMASSYNVSYDADDFERDGILDGSAQAFGGGGGYSSNKQASASFAGPYLTTTVPFHSYHIDSAAEPVAELESTLSTINDIFSKISWLKGILNDDDTLTLDSETYFLGLNETISNQPECQNSLNNTTGACTLLHECPQIHKELTDLAIYKKYFCHLESYAAVCCPVPSSVAVKGH